MNKHLSIGRNKTKTDIPAHLANVDEINDYFLNSSHNRTMLRGHYAGIGSIYNTSKHVNYKSAFSFQLVDEADIIKAMNKIKTNATGHDKISIKMLRLFGRSIIPYILNIVNSCILHCYFPQAWKEAVVLPLPKVNNVTDYKQLRPISVLPVVSRFWNEYCATSSHIM